MVLIRFRPIGRQSRCFLKQRSFQKQSKRLFTESGSGNGHSLASEAADSSRFSSRTMLALGVAGIAIATSLLISKNTDSASNSPTDSTPLLEERVQRLEGMVSKLRIIQKNKAFVFIKPHAVTTAVEDLVNETFKKHKIKVIKSGEITGPQIDQQLLVDNHYGAIASKAVKFSPSFLTVSDKGKEDFKQISNGMTWDEAVSKGFIRNAKDYCEAKDIDGQELDKRWSQLKRGENLVKLGGGFYCGKLENDEFVINGFYMAMRDKFTGANDKIKYFVVEFLPNELSWSKFRGEVLGGTDPSGAPKGSMRRSIYDNWKKLGLNSQPNTGDNCVHASASPFEAFAERCNWLKDEYKVGTDEFGEALLLNGMLMPTIQEYMEDPAIEFEGKKESVFDMLEDLDTEECFDKVLRIAGL